MNINVKNPFFIKGEHYNHCYSTQIQTHNDTMTPKTRAKKKPFLTNLCTQTPLTIPPQNTLKIQASTMFPQVQLVCKQPDSLNAYRTLAKALSVNSNWLGVIETKHRENDITGEGGSQRALLYALFQSPHPSPSLGPIKEGAVLTLSLAMKALSWQLHRCGLASHKAARENSCGQQQWQTTPPFWPKSYLFFFHCLMAIKKFAWTYHFKYIHVRIIVAHPGKRNQSWGCKRFWAGLIVMKGSITHLEHAPTSPGCWWHQSW